MEDDLEAELRNPFPSPPSHYQRFTSENLKLLALLKSRVASGEANGDASQVDVLSDQKDVPDWDLHLLEPPRVDWMIEDGEYSAFGDTWKLREEVESLAKAGGTQLFPDDSSADRRPHLKAVLRTLLASYTRVLDAAVQPPPTNDAIPPEWTHPYEWMHIMGQNIMAAANDLRPAQARVNLESLMRRQVELRREETRMIHDKCDALEQMLVSLQQRTSGKLGQTQSVIAEPITGPSFLGDDHGDGMVLDVMPLTMQDVLLWSEDDIH